MKFSARRLIGMMSGVVVAILASTAGAQPAPPAGPAVPAASAEKIALARELVAASGGEQQFKDIMGAYIQTMQGALARNLSPERARIQAVVQKEMTAQVMGLTPQLIDATVRIYAETLTEQELRDAVAWQSSESGRAIQKKMPTITRRSVETTVPMVIQLMPKAITAAIDAACVEAKCTPQERQIIADAVAKATPKKAS